MKRNLTRNDIAAEAGVSPSTVSRALAGSPLIPQKTIERVRKIAEKLGYRPNILARRLSSNRSFEIGFAVELWPERGKGPIHYSYYASILDAMIFSAFKKNYSVSVRPYFPSERGVLSRLENLFIGRHVDGFIFAGLKQTDTLPVELNRRNVPFVVIGTKPRDRKLISVNVDHSKGVDEMFSAFERNKYKRIFFVEGDMEFYHAVSQREAFFRRLEKSRIKLVEIFKGDYSRKAGYDAAARIVPLLKDGDCVFLSNDRMATGFYHSCCEKGIRIPGAVGVAGSDDDDSASVLYPELCTMHQPREEMGGCAMDLMIDMIEGKKVSSVVIDQHFIERKSL